jgi:hypothetical protein
MARKRKRKVKPKDKLGRKDLGIRDDLLVSLINGATKAGVEKDRKKESDRRRAREPITPED